MTGNTELAEMIANWLDVAQCGRVRVAVHSDPPNGWHPAVVGAPAAADKDPRDEAAIELGRACNLNL